MLAEAVKLIPELSYIYRRGISAGSFHYNSKEKKTEGESTQEKALDAAGDKRPKKGRNSKLRMRLDLTWNLPIL